MADAGCGAVYPVRGYWGNMRIYEGAGMGEASLNITMFGSRYVCYEEFVLALF